MAGASLTSRLIGVFLLLLELDVPRIRAITMLGLSAQQSAQQSQGLQSPAQPGLDPEPFSPDKVSSKLDELACMCDAKQKYPKIFSQLSLSARRARTGSSSSSEKTALTSGSQLTGRTAGGNPCTCDPFASQDPGPTNEIDGVVYWVNTCQITGKDLDFWRLRNTDYRPGGIMLQKTVAYANSCDDCATHNLKCDAAPTTIYTGYCLCMWRVDGADPKLKMVPCGRCPTDCLGKYVNFDIGGYMRPTPQRGICIKKKGYFR